MVKSLLYIVLSFSFSPNIFAIGTDIHNFNLSLDSSGFVILNSAEVSKYKQLELAIFGAYSKNSLPYFQSNLVFNGDSQDEPKNSHVYSSLGVSYGLSKKLQINTVIGYLFNIDSDPSPVLDTIATENKMTHINLGVKYQLTKQFSAIATINHKDDNDNPYTGLDALTSFQLGLAWSKKFGNTYLLAANIAYSIRGDGEEVTGSGVKPIGDQVSYALGIAKDLSSTDKLSLEIFGSSPVDDQTSISEREVLSSEWLIAYSKAINDFSFSVGGGGEIQHGLGTPGYRVFLGLRWRPGHRKKQSLTAKVKKENKGPYTDLSLPQKQFDTSSSQMSEVLVHKMDEIVNWIQEKREVIKKIIIVGHTDTTGSASKNNELSYERALTAKKYIQNKINIPDTSFDIIGMGEKYPISDNDEENRRLEIRFRF